MFTLLFMTIGQFVSLNPFVILTNYLMCVAHVRLLKLKVKCDTLKDPAIFTYGSFARLRNIIIHSSVSEKFENKTAK